MENWFTDKDLARAATEKKKEWIETFHNDNGTSYRIHYQGDPITHKEFVMRTRSARLDIPEKPESIDSRFEILDL
jgi:hypothetical protein